VGRIPTVAKLAVVCAAALVFALGYARWYAAAVITTPVRPGLESMESNLDPETAARLMQVVAAERDRLGVPSLQVAVILPDGAWWTGSVGWADPRARRAANVRDRYYVGSVTKLYTSAVILKLAEAGRLSLDDPVSRFIPETPNGDRITIRHLLNHTSGLYNYTESVSFLAKTVLFRKRWTADEVWQIVADHPPYFEPGARHFYSNGNYHLLGMIAERAGGRPFSELLKEHVLSPLGLTNTFFAPQEPAPTGTVRGYDVSLFGLGRLGIKKDMEGLRDSFESASFTAGGITASALDVARFTRALFHGDLLSAESKEAMTRFVEAPDEDVPAQTGYGLGVRRLELGGVTFIGHTGIFPGFSNISMYAPDTGHVVTVLSNLSAVEVTRVVEAVLTELHVLGS